MGFLKFSTEPSSEPGLSLATGGAQDDAMDISRRLVEEEARKAQREARWSFEVSVFHGLCTVGRENCVEISNEPLPKQQDLTASSFVARPQLHGIQ